MKERRTFSNQVVGSDAFLSIPAAAQALYFQLCMASDDDGIVGYVSRVISDLGLSRKELNILSNKGYIILFDSGVCAIRHWRINNTIRKDRYKPTLFDNELSMLKINENETYSLLVEQNATEIQPEINPNVEKENTPHKRESLDSFFESIWKLYPIKKGKGKVSKTQKQKLQKIGYDQIKRCVERFVEEAEKEHRDKQYWPHGSTFFNSGYIDYLDENCEEETKETIPEKPEQIENKDRFSCLPSHVKDLFVGKGIIEIGSDSINFGYANKEDMRLMKEYGLL